MIIHNCCDEPFISPLIMDNKDIWRPPSLSELTPTIFNMGLTHLGSDASKYSNIF